MPVLPPSRETSVRRSLLWIAFILILWWLLGCGSTSREDDLCTQLPCQHGAVVRGDTTKKELTLVFTGDEFADGGDTIASVLKKQRVKGAFFFTGNFYRNPAFSDVIRRLRDEGHYLGAHSDRHLLYCSWENRDSLLVTKEDFRKDLAANYREMDKFGILRSEAPYFLPPYEWYNDSISRWTRDFGLQLINFTAGTRSNADYTTPEMTNYRSSQTIYDSIISFEVRNATGLSGFLLLIHIGTAPERTDKFYFRLEELIAELKAKGYRFKSLNDLLQINAGTGL